jgi:hypothetical protein
MYFANFPKIVYDFNLSNGTDYKIVTDITKNVRIRKQILENISLYDYYDISEGETPEIVSEKIYGTPYYHWVIMLANQRYDYINDFPLSQLELDALIDKRYGNKKYQVHDYKVDGLVKEGVNILTLRDSASDGGGIGEMAVGKIVTSTTNGYEGRIDSIIAESNGTTIQLEVSLRTGKFVANEVIKLRNEITYAEVVSSVIPAKYTTTSNYDYEYAVNESKRRIRIIDPALIEQLVKEFKDII